MNKSTPTNANKPQVVFLIVRRNILLSKSNSNYPDNLKENEKVCKRNYSKHRSKCRYAQDFFVFSKHITYYSAYIQCDEISNFTPKS